MQATKLKPAQRILGILVYVTTETDYDGTTYELERVADVELLVVDQRRVRWLFADLNTGEQFWVTQDDEPRMLLVEAGGDWSKARTEMSMLLD